MAVIVTATTLAFSGAAVSGDAASAAPDVLGALDMTYVQQVTEHLTTIGSTEMGFRVMGTPQDQETAEYIASQMTAIGLDGVDVETFAGDGWLFEGGSVRARGPGIDRTFKATSNGSVPGTGPRGVRGDLVFVGHGTASEYAGLDVEGKVVFAWWDYDTYGIWPNYIAYEAKAHGALAVVMASAPGHAWYAAGQGRALGGNDGECGPECAPLVIVSKRTGHKLVNKMSTGRVRAKVVLEAENLLGADSFQAIGAIPGSTHPDQVIVFTAHHDAWFTSAADDSVAVAMMLAIAKAAVDSGYQPEYTWIFAPVTGEEYGLYDAYYDWLQGAFQRITVSHPEWQTDAVAILNWELHSPPYGLGATVARELRPFLGASLSASQADGLIAGYGLSEIYSWNDGFTYTAEGAPAITFGASGGHYGRRYHTDYDSLDTLDFPRLAPVLEAEARVALDLDASIVPWGFANRIRDLGKHLDAAAMETYGADATSVTDAYARLQAAWADAATATPSACVAGHVREAVRISDDDLTALSFWDDTIYPQELAQWDLSLLDSAIALLEAGRWKAALTTITNIDLNFLAPIVSRAGFDAEQLHHSPGYAKISWGGQGQLYEPIDLYDLWHGIAASSGPAPGGDFSSEIVELTSIRDGLIPVYQARVGALADTLDDVAHHLELAAMC
jgi:N-acetylated-alpha-linked acidic dipeptidase